ncbi:putative bifunctional diguanylate cyclase/phosphodiesterase [Xanthobacter agilis]|uniref:Diguanylate cyclase (GGDEF)-like protein n=1 Tax=Xanthobacter agilis TaxID=47492 RepID=A0ABU0LH54_XANAG|nr:EAL domain-containing protein [Xanthobacter agilis]MDQ0506428.1 diguanylate cyclase (GGDEF)-like protein [Xanthobacter agilis]
MLLSFAAMLAIMGITSMTWEFALQERVLPRLGIFVSDCFDDPSRWRFIITAVVFAALSQLGPALLLFRLMRRLDRARIAVIKAREEADALARHDPLTGLASRRMLHEHMRRRLAGAAGSGGYALLLIDIERFKAITDLHGHQMGDRLLIEIANRMRRLLPPDAIASRVGEEEFAAFLPRPRTVEALGKIAQQFISELSARYQLAGLDARLGATIGIAVTPENGTDGGEVMRSAEAALYRAKGTGTYRFFEPAMDRELKQSQRLQRDLHNAIAADAVIPHYQPLVRLKDGVVVGFEVLARWNHPMLGSISPEVFISIAEDAGLIGQLTQSILKQACVDASKWPDQIKIAVNLSPIQLKDTTLPDQILHTLKISRFPPQRLELEITETALVNDNRTANAILSRFRAMGIDIALDDFGTGYSSLQNLRMFPVTKLKIDKSFVRSMSLDANSKKLISGILALSRSLGITTTAEGIEEAAEAEYLRSIGCDFGQGYCYAKPMKADDVPRFLTVQVPA